MYIYTPSFSAGMRTCLLEDEQFSKESVFVCNQREGLGDRDVRISLRAKHLNRSVFYGPMNQFTAYEVVQL